VNLYLIIFFNAVLLQSEVIRDKYNVFYEISHNDLLLSYKLNIDNYLHQFYFKCKSKSKLQQILSILLLISSMTLLTTHLYDNHDSFYFPLLRIYFPVL